MNLLENSVIRLQVHNLPAPFRDIQQTVYHPAYRMPVFHSHGYFQMVYVEEGGMCCMTDSGEHVLRPGEYVIFAPGVSHTWENRSGRQAKMMNVHVLDGAAGFAEPLRALETICGGAVYFGQDDGEFAAGIKEMEREVKQGRFGYKLHLGTVLTGFLLNVLRSSLDRQQARAQVKAVTRIDRALWFIEQHMGEKITLDDIAAHLGVTGKHACDLFRDAVGMPPVAYLNRVRMERAQLLLSGTLLRTGEIGRMVGIDDEHYFSRTFRKFAGMSPTKFRKQEMT